MIARADPLVNASEEFERPGLSYEQGRYAGFNPLFSGNQDAPLRAADWNWLSLHFSPTQSQLQAGTPISGVFTTVTATNLILPKFTQGSALFVGAGGVVTQSNPFFFFDNANSRLGLATSIPTVTLDVNGDIRDRNMTAGSVLFAGANGVISQNNASLFWDIANKRLGIGNAAPGVELDVTGAGRFSGAFTLTARGANNVLYTGAAGLVTSGNLTFDGTTLGLTGSEAISSSLTLSAIAANRMLYTGAAGLISSASTFYADGTSVGLGTATPRRRLDLLDTANPQFRLTYADNSVYTDFQVLSTGTLRLLSTSGIVQVAQSTPTVGLAYLQVSSASNTNIGWDETGQPANGKLWDVLVNAGVMQFRVVNDAVTVATSFLTVTRSGTTISSVNFPVGLYATVAGTGVTWRHTNTNYVGSLGAFSNAGNPFVGLHAIHGASADIPANDGSGIKGAIWFHNQAAQPAVVCRWNGVATANANFSSTKDALTIDALGNVACNDAALATNATDGFLYLAGSAGAPTGAPTAFAGRYAVEYDGTNDQLNVYNGSWKALTAGKPVLTAYKSSDTTRTNTTAPTDDPALSLSLAANSTYEFEFSVFWTTASVTAGFKFQLGNTVGVTSLKAEFLGTHDSTNAWQVVTRVTALASSASDALTGDNYVIVKGTIETSTAGTLTFQWAQSTADAVTGTTVQRNSFCKAMKIG